MIQELMQDECFLLAMKNANTLINSTTTNINLNETKTIQNLPKENNFYNFLLFVGSALIVGVLVYEYKKYVDSKKNDNL